MQEYDLQEEIAKYISYSGFGMMFVGGLSFFIITFILPYLGVNNPTFSNLCLAFGLLIAGVFLGFSLVAIGIALFIDRELTKEDEESVCFKSSEEF